MVIIKIRVHNPFLLELNLYHHPKYHLSHFFKAKIMIISQSILF